VTIPESQLQTWSHQGSIQTSKITHESIRTALKNKDSVIKNLDFEIYLQGSYKNSTNIRGDSDVDVVVQLNSTFQGDTSLLSAEDRERYQETFPDADYHWSDFRSDVLDTLKSYYGPDVIREGNKSVKINKTSSRLPADVVVALQHNLYTSFPLVGEPKYIEGIVFYTRSGSRKIVNYPKVHYEFGVHKNSNTNSNFKPAVRMFKNARNYAEQESGQSTPSYFLECLIFNVPNSNFETNLATTFYNVILWLYDADLVGLDCQNKIIPLFGDSSDQWSVENARLFIDAIINLWNNWS